MSIKNVLLFMLLVLLAVVIFAPAVNNQQAMATMHPAISSVYTAATAPVLEAGVEQAAAAHQSLAEHTLNSDAKVLMEVVVLLLFGMLASTALRGWTADRGR